MPEHHHDGVLHDGWTLRATGGPVPAPVAAAPIPAAVPGCVHTDLLAAGLIEDPYRDRVEEELRWLHDVDWQLRRPLRLAPAADDERVDLVFEGIDTVATVRLGDVVLGHPRNMHRSHRYDVRALADGVGRDLVVDLDSATRYAESERERLGERPGAYPTPYPYLRKMACSFGWDWGPDLRTAGLWQPVSVHRWRVARLAEVRPLVTVAADGTGAVEVRVGLERSGLEPATPLQLRLRIAGVEETATVPADAATASLTARVPRVPLWWPTGHGDQPLFALELSLHAGDAELDCWQRRVGFRTVELDTSDDEHGTAFTLRVNGRPVFVKGANWIPDDHFLTRVTTRRLAERLDQAVAANLNLLRVWGGGRYESESFYELADERGLMVWQDFLLACAAYPEESPLAEELEAEARENVTRLACHPSLVVWNGGNENLWGHEDWGWKERLGGRSWGAGYAGDLLRRVVEELDPTRPYCDNSPYSPRRTPDQVHPNHPDHGTHHQWEVWNRIDYTAYRSEIPRFCSEFGFQGPPTWRTLADSVHAEDGTALEHAADPKLDPVWLAHQKAEDGNGKLDRALAAHVGIPTRFTDWLWATQLIQARAVAHAVEHYRSWWPRTAGAIVWQLNDCWPVTSWSAVDSAGRPKPLWYALRRAMAPRALVLAERDGGSAVCVVNDTDLPWNGTLRLRRETLTGGELAAAEVTVAAGPRSVAVHAVPAPLVAWSDPTREVLVATLGEQTAVLTAVEDLDLELDPDPVELSLDRTPTGYRLHVTARSLVRDLTVLVDRLDPDGAVSDGLVTLPAGATAVLDVTCRALDDEGALLTAPVLRTANDLKAVPHTTAPPLPALS